MGKFGLSRKALLSAAALLLMSWPAAASRRVALIIGNAEYWSLPKLKNSANEAAKVRDTLRDAGFETFYGVNLTRLQIEALLRKRASSLTPMRRRGRLRGAICERLRVRLSPGRRRQLRARHCRGEPFFFARRASCIIRRQTEAGIATSRDARSAAATPRAAGLSRRPSPSLGPSRAASRRQDSAEPGPSAIC